MNTLLTNGKTTLVPELVEFHPLDQESDPARPLRLEPQHLFGPVRERLAPKLGLLWWGHFALGQRVSFTVYADKDAELRLRILDHEYRVIAERIGQASVHRLTVTIPQSGAAYFHLVNEAEASTLAFLQVAIAEAEPPALARTAARPRLVERIKHWLVPPQVATDGVTAGPTR